MSEYIPFEIQVEIMKRLPVKSLLRFRCVSKRWKFLIDSSEFMAAYNFTQSQLPSLIVPYKDPDPVSREKKFVSFVDDDETFALQDFNLTVPVLAKQLKHSPSVLGSSQGLLCLYGYSQNPPHSVYNMSGMVVLWNPSIRKSIGIAVNGVLCFNSGQTVVGFGVCPATNDPTIVKFTNSGRWGSPPNTPWVVEVFSLSSGTWRIASGKPPSGSITVRWGQVTIDKFIYWHSYDGIPIGGISTKNLIMSYDMTTEEIGAIELPDSLAHQPSFCLTICKVRESLAMLEHNDKKVCSVWMMDHGGVPNLFTKVFTINTPNWSNHTITLGFTKSGKPILMSTQPEAEKAPALVIYEPCSEQIKDIGINIDGRFGLVCVASYMETLLLHDQSDCKVYS